MGKFTVDQPRLPLLTTPHCLIMPVSPHRHQPPPRLAVLVLTGCRLLGLKTRCPISFTVPDVLLSPLPDRVISPVCTVLPWLTMRNLNPPTPPPRLFTKL